jgi:competence protein ComEC
MNRYGHPHEELLDRLDEAGSQVIITYESGAITIRTDGDRGVTGGRGY